jgi:hypothetical protein
LKLRPDYNEIKQKERERYKQWQQGNHETLKKAKERELKRRKEIKEVRMRHRYHKYKRGAKIRDLLFELTKEEAYVFFQLDCYYCGSIPDPENGIDRKDNNIGYIVSNCVPCCWDCNRMKADITVDDFLAHCRKIINHSDGI